MLALTWDVDAMGADLSYSGGALLASGQDLETAILLSLFLDAPARSGDRVPAGASLGGWWGDSLEPSQDVDGSRLWLLHAESASQASANRAQEYAQEALAWIADDGEVEAIDVEVEVSGEAVLLRVIATLDADGDQRQFGPFTVVGA